jgi:capsular polysaccharide biosynthesis protein
MKKFSFKNILKRLLNYKILVKDYENTKDYFLRNDGYYRLLYPSSSEKINQNQISQEFFRPMADLYFAYDDIFITSISHGKYISKFNSYITSNDILLDDLSYEDDRFGRKFGFEHGIFKALEKDETKYVDKNIAVLSTVYEYNYFHWMINTLPKLDLFEKCKSDIDYYVISNKFSFQKDSLKYFDIPEDKIIENHEKLNIKAGNLIATSLNGSIEFVTRQGLDFMRKKFNTQKFYTKNIYISRNNPKFLNNNRMIINEKEVIDVLKKYGFEVYDLENISFAGQMELFSQAKTIIGVHGAGLTNMIFSGKKAKIIEINNPKYLFSRCYNILAYMLEMEYYCLLGEGEIDLTSYNIIEDIFVDIKKLEKVLEKAGL